MTRRQRFVFIISILSIIGYICTPAMAIKILQPGDTVKGKIITEKYYCLSEEENLKILNRLGELDLLKQLIALKEQQIEMLKDTMSLMRQRIDVKDDTKDRMITEYDKAIEREKTLKSEVDKEHREVNRQKRRNRRSFTIGVILGVAARALLLGL